jgi:IclR family acetate operon transcriptional repressor
LKNHIVICKDALRSVPRADKLTLPEDGGKLFQNMNESLETELTPSETEPATSGTGTRIQSVARASQILFWVANQPHGATAKEIATAQNLALPTAYHLLNTLVDQGMLAKSLHRRYILGRGVAILAEAHLRGKAVPDALLNALRDVARRTEETAYLADWGGYDIRVLASIEGRQMVRVAEVGSGAYEHGHARANGKVLLAFAPPEAREAYLRAHPLVPVTKSTISTPRQFEEELERIRERGYAYDHNEYVDGVSCVAAPVRLNGHVVAALGLSVPTHRFDRTQAELTAALLDVVSGLEWGEPAVAPTQ